MEKTKKTKEELREELLTQNKELYPNALWDNMNDDVFDEYVISRNDYDVIFISGLTYKEWLIAKSIISLTHGEIYSMYSYEHYIIFED